MGRFRDRRREHVHREPVPVPVYDEVHPPEDGRRPEADRQRQVRAVQNRGAVGPEENREIHRQPDVADGVQGVKRGVMFFNF